MFSLDGKRALVTGSSRGLGREMALALARAGADIILTGRDEATLAQTAGEISALGREAQGLALDMADASACEAGFEACLRDHGPIDILINNVGGRGTSEPVAEQSLESWQRTIDKNMTSCFLGTKIIGGAVAREVGGRVINVSSTNAFVANRGIGNRAYEASKAAIVQFTRATAADWAPYGMTVNAICPGLFMTDANKAWRETKPEVIEKLVSGIPMGRAGEPAEIGGLAVFLASSAASYITGGVYVIDGGYTLW